MYLMFKLAQNKDNMNVGDMEGGHEQKLRMCLNESPQYFHHQGTQNGFTAGSVSSVSPVSVGSFPGGFFVSENGSSSETPFGYSKSVVLLDNNSNGHLDDDFGLSDNFSRMHIGIDGHRKYASSDNNNNNIFNMSLGFHSDVNINQHLYDETMPCNINGPGAYNDVDHSRPTKGHFQPLVGGYSQTSYDQNKGALFEFPPHGFNNYMGSQDHFPVLSCQSASESRPRGYALELRDEPAGRGFFNGRIHLQDPSLNHPCSEHHPLYHLEDRGLLRSKDIYKLENGNLVFGVANPTFITAQETRGVPSCLASPTLLSMPNAVGIGGCNRRSQLRTPTVHSPCYNDPLCYLQEGSFLNSKDSCMIENPGLRFGVENQTYVTEENTGGVPSCKANPMILSMPNTGCIRGFAYENSFILEENGVTYVADKQCNHLKSSLNGNSLANQQEKKKELLNLQYHSGKVYGKDSRLHSSVMPIVPAYGSLLDLEGSIYYMTKDQIGCRFLQKKIEEGTTEDVCLIFNETIDHVVELMINPFGNYLIQKLIEVCSEDQRLQIVLTVSADPRVLVKICSDAHGTCSMQKLIKSLKTRQQITILTVALEPGFLQLIKDVNGNHVLQCCLKCLGHNSNKFLLNAATKYCVEIATHRHGCCVLNQCIAHSTGKHREKLTAVICANALMLAQDSFGNYVIQFVLELKIPSAAGPLLSQFEGNYVYLSMQKFSSHVVEKCLKFFEESRPKIIAEFLSVPYFSQLLQDPFANYVVQSALEVSKGHLRAALVQAIEAHSILRTSPYCKKIFSRNLLKK